MYSNICHCLTDQYGIPDENSNHKKMYKFQLHHKHLKENYFTREVGDGEGYWKAHTTVTTIVGQRIPTVGPVSLTEGPTTGTSVREPNQIGYKMRFVFYESKAEYGTASNWIMDEYRVKTNYLPNSSQVYKLFIFFKMYKFNQNILFF